MRNTLLLLLLPLALVFADTTSVDSTTATSKVVAGSTVPVDTTVSTPVVDSSISTTPVVAMTDEKKSPETTKETSKDESSDKKEEVKKDKKDEKKPFPLMGEAKLKSTMLFFIIGGLAIFLLGMNHMSSGLQTVAGPKLRSLIGAVTNNRIFASTIGVLVTMIVQSSSVTTVMVVGFVNSGLMALKQALGVIFGANIGTTITGWMIALKIGKFGLPILALAAFFYLFSKRDRVKYVAMAIMGIGMVFFGLQLMKYGFKPIANDPQFEAFFAKFAATSYLGVMKCVFAGAILTAIVQSSSATLGITMSLAATGAIPFETAAALVLGENIGTTITAYLASLNTTTAAKRAAYGHMLFNVLGVLWITSIFGLYMNLINGFYGSFESFFINFFNKGKEADEVLGSVEVKIALVHTGFNVVNTLLFIPLLNPLSKLLHKIVPDKEYKEKNHLTSLTHVTMFESPDIALEEAKIEVDLMATKVATLGTMVKELIESNEFDDKKIRKIFELEENLDTYQSEVTTFLMDLLATKSLSHETVETNQRLFRLADEYESVSDYFVNIVKRFLMLNEQELSFGKDERQDILELHEKMTEFLNDLNESVKVCNFQADAKLITEADAVKLSFKSKRQAHLTRLSDTTVAPILSVAFMDVLTYYRRINDHMINISEVVQK